MVAKRMKKRRNHVASVMQGEAAKINKESRRKSVNDVK